MYLRGLSDYPLVEKSAYQPGANMGEMDSWTERRYVYGLGGLVAFQRGDELAFVLRDHLGSTRAVISSDGTSGVGYSYDALGNLIDQRAFGVSMTDLAYRYTGQEFDRETGLHNFRARLYDSDLFRFYSTDPAGQDFSPYTFVGNNPIIHVDPSGKWFFTALLPGVGTVIDAVLWGATWGAGASAATYLGTSAIFSQPITLSGFGQAVGLGALSGAFSGGFSLLGGQLGSFGTSLTYSLLSNAGTYAATTALTGGQLDLPGLLGSIGGATIGAIFPPFQAPSNNPFESIFAELAYGAFKGGVVGGFSSGLTSAFRGQDPVAGFVQGFKYGAASGGVSTALNIGLWGYAKPYDKTSLKRIAQAEEYYGVKLGQNLPTLRSGGASRLFSNRGFSWFDSSILNADGNEIEVSAHEGVHAVQRTKLGWFNFYKKLSGEQGLLRSINVYSIKGYYEYDAQRIGKGLKP